MTVVPSRAPVKSPREVSQARIPSRRSGVCLTILAVAALAVIVGWWTWRALHDEHHVLDFRLVYDAGLVSWRNGHPERLFTWTGTPLLAALSALGTRVESLTAGSETLTVLNMLLVLSTVAAVMWRLRGQVATVWWWVLTVALLSFGPMMSTVWWKQLNIIALVLALAGFELLRRRRPGAAAALIALSVAIKPLVFLLPIVLLVRRETRRVGALAVAWIVGLTMAAQAFLAVRAHALGPLNPFAALSSFLSRTQPGTPHTPAWACMAVNFSPQSTLCRLAGRGDWTLQHIVVLIAVGVLGTWTFDALRGRRASSWETFAFVCPLSAMLSPLAWSHYQILLAPLFVLLVVRFTNEGASVGTWTGLAVAFALASLMWEPYGTSIGAVSSVLRGHAESPVLTLHLAVIAEFAQYALLISGLLWYTRRLAVRPARGAGDTEVSYSS
ncbi:MAG: glycosyltransferase family 87 protein [Solirubrobacteraceae bacterium]